MALVCFIIGILIVALSIAFAVKNRHNTKKWIASVTVGVFFSTLFMVFPTAWIKEGHSVEFPILYRFISALFYTFKALGGRQDISQIESIGLSGWLKSLYVVINYCSFVTAPVLASSLLLSFFGDTLQKIQYWLSFAPTCCVFSELNENSIALAKSVKDGKGREIIVFCKTKKVDEELTERARKLGGILLYTSCTKLNIDFKFKKHKYEFYLIAEDEDKNIQDAEKFISRKEKLKNRTVITNVFTQGMTNVEILENMIPAKPLCRIFDTLNETSLAFIDKKARKGDIAIFLNTKEDKDSKLKFGKTAKENTVYFCKGNLSAKVLSDIDDLKSFIRVDYRKFQCVLESEEPDSTVDKPKYRGKAVRIRNRIFGEKMIDGWLEERFQMRFIDEIDLFCNQQILDHPLYNLPSDKKEIIVMIVGCGYWGMHMLKTIVWAGQIQGYSLKIYVYDKESSEIKGSFYQQCPELDNKKILKENTIHFVQADFMSDDFEDKIKDSLNATYVCVATGDDKLNFTVSEKLYRIFRRNAIKKNKPDLYTPKIFTRVRKSIKSDNYSKSSYLKERGIYLFGTADSFFSKGTLFNTQFEKLAFATHLCYCDVLGKEQNDADYQLAKRDFYSNEYNRRSSMATALHFGAKILTCNGVIPEKDKPTSDKKTKTEAFSDEDINAYKNNLDKAKDVLIKNEHNRWNCFIASEGWHCATISEMQNYIPTTNSHKDDLSKSHACLLTFDDLDNLQKEYDKYRELKNKKLKERNFKSEDEKIIMSLPNIVEEAKKMYEEENKNV